MGFPILTNCQTVRFPRIGMEVWKSLAMPGIHTVYSPIGMEIYLADKCLRQKHLLIDSFQDQSPGSQAAKSPELAIHLPPHLK